MLAKAIISIAVLLLMATAQAADLQRGLEAYQRGDYETALAEFEPLAAQGDPVAQFSLGVIYDNGEGVQQDYEQAFNWFRQAAEQGHARAQGHLGRMYFLGRGTEEDLVQAYIWFDLAVAQGDDRFGLSQKTRRLAEEKMTPAQLQQAQEQSAEYMALYVDAPQPGDTTTQSSAPNTSPTTDTAISPPAPIETPVAAINVPTPPTPMPVTSTQPASSDLGNSSTTPLAIPPLTSPATIETPATPVATAPEPTVDTSQVQGTETNDPDTTRLASPTVLTPPPVTSLNQPAAIQTPPQTDLTTTTFPRTETNAPVTPGSDDDTASSSTTPLADTSPEPTPTPTPEPSPEPEVATTRAATATVSPPPPRVRTPIQPSPEGRFRVQLASLSSSDRASAEGSRLQQRHPQLLGQLTVTVQSANIDQSVVHRVQVGPLSYGSANSLCRALKRNHQSCLVVNR